MREALTVALAQFEGTVILVSHDRHLLRATADEFMLVGSGTLQPFDGDLDDYHKWLLQQAAQRRNVLIEGASDASAASGGDRRGQRRAEAQERQRLAEQRKPLQKEIAVLERELERLNAERTRLEALLADEAIYKEANKQILTDSLRLQAEVKHKLERIEADWLSKQDALEAIK
jgi:ATP-binding cassette subfamily F protein 3